jgi:hypothetical protein
LLTKPALQSPVAEAIARRSAAGLPDSAASWLANVKFVIADLAESYLGLTDGNTIYIDRDAADYSAQHIPSAERMSDS